MPFCQVENLAMEYFCRCVFNYICLMRFFFEFPIRAVELNGTGDVNVER